MVKEKIVKKEKTLKKEKVKKGKKVKEPTKDLYDILIIDNIGYKTLYTDKYLKRKYLQNVLS